jgi:hypothetical protein
MDVDESVRRIGDELDKWSGSIFAMLASGDEAALGKALIEGFAFTKEINRLKKQGMAAISAVLESKADATDSERVASLVQAFAVGARLGDALRDELSDIDGKSKVWRLLDAILLALDKIGTGRAALAVLFDSPDAGVRAAAGAYLIDLMPGRVVPMLRAIDEAAAARAPILAPIEFS